MKKVRSMKLENEHSIYLALEAKKASEEFHLNYPNSTFDKFYMGYVKGFQAALELIDPDCDTDPDVGTDTTEPVEEVKEKVDDKA
jgi:hypothetical protein